MLSAEEIELLKTALASGNVGLLIVLIYIARKYLIALETRMATIEAEQRQIKHELEIRRLFSAPHEGERSNATRKVD